MYKYRKWKTICSRNILFVALILLGACDNGIVGTGAKPEQTKRGLAQKGPFEIGSNINIVIRPGPDYVETDTVQVQTIDGIGNFDFTFEPDTLYDITVTGRWFNEVTGQLSAEPHSLKSSYYHEQNNQSFVSINILTHFINTRINYLIANDVHPRDASIQASEELIRELRDVLFAKHLRDQSFSSLAVYNLEDSDTNANAVLLFISAAFYQQSLMFPASASVSETIDFIASDLELDGRIDADETNTTELTPIFDLAARLLNPDTITSNLTDYSVEVSGGALPVPDISFLLDNDSDGITNDIDNDDDGDGFLDSVDENPYTFEIISSQQTFTTIQNSAVEIDLQFSQPESHLLDSVWVGYPTLPSNGQLTGAYPNIVYTPNTGYTGTDSFTYVVHCIALLYTSEVATVEIDVQAPN